MKATVEKLEKNRVALHIEVDEEAVSAALNQAYKRLAMRVNIPGFRKGKAPRPVIERYVGKGVLYQEALEGMVPEVYEQAVRETQIEPIDQPQFDVEQFEEGKVLKLRADVEVKPEVVLRDYKGIAVERVVERVTNELVDDYIYHLRESAAELVTAQRTAVQEGDFVTIDFTGYIDGKAFAGGAATGYTLEIGGGRFIPGFEEQLVGAEVGTERQVKVTFPADYYRSELAGKDAVFEVKVHEIKERKLPALDDDFAKDVSEFSTLLELRADIRGNLEKQAAARADEAMRSNLVRMASERAEVEIPAVMVEREIDRMLMEFARSLALRGVDFDRYLEATGRTVQELREENKAAATERVRSRLVLEAIAEREGITVAAEEIDRRIEEIAASAGSQADEVRKRYSEADRREDLVYGMRLEKAIDLLVSSAKITTKEVDPPVQPGHEGHAAAVASQGEKESPADAATEA